jgi:enoyl-CoA hydratase/carnithine racemase
LDDLTALTDAASQALQREQLGAVAVLTLSRPGARNSLSAALLADLIDAFAEIRADESIRAVVLAAAGPAFCAGHDLREMNAHRGDPDGGRAFYESVFARCSELMQAIVRLPQPVIACVGGTATAAGCQLVAACDLAVASEAATFATPGVNIGLFCSSPMVALTRNVSRKHAMEMLLTGDFVPAADALRFGLVNRVARAGEERAEAMGLARLIASKSPAAIRIGKPAFYRQLELSLSEAYEHVSKVMVENMLNPDASEGIAAFLAKRSPNWGGGDGEATARSERLR